MWPAFLLGLLSELFNESTKPEGFILKGVASGMVGMILNLSLFLLLANQASSLIGYEISVLSEITLEFLFVPLIAAFVGLIIVKLARFFSKMEQWDKPST